MKEQRSRFFVKIAARHLAGDLHRVILGREADARGLASSVAAIRKNGSIAPAVEQLLASREYQARIAAKPEKRSAAPTPVKGRLIAVSAICQTGGLAAALRECLPHDTIRPLPPPGPNDAEAATRFAAEILKADAWVTSSLDERQLREGCLKIRIPNLQFRAFHPDICYARHGANMELTPVHYNSGIAVWAYNKGLGISDATRLFNRDSYLGLGYLGLWNPSVDLLRKSFEECELDFAPFILPVKRNGVFMHTINHPKPDAIIQLAKLIALKLGADPSIMKKDIVICDSLMDYIWPLYPEIGDELSLPHGSHDWKLGEVSLHGIDDYLQFAFKEYETLGIPRGGLIMQHRDSALYDSVLGPQAGIS